MLRFLNGRLLKRSAAVLCAAVVVVSAFGISTVKLSVSDDKAFYPKPQRIAALTVKGGDSENQTPPTDNSNADSSSSDSDSAAENTENENSSSEFSQTAESKNDSAVYESYFRYYTDKSDYEPTDTASESDTSHAADSTDSSASSGVQDKKNDKSSNDLSSLDLSSSTGGNHRTDDGSKVDKPGNRPTDGGDTDTVYFTTSIEDGERVSEREYSFTVTHLKKELDVKSVYVYLNGSASAYSGTISLSEQNGGKNTVSITAVYTDKDGKVISASRSYTIYLELPDSSSDEEKRCALVCDLTSHTRSQAELEFTAYISGSPTEQKITVYLGTKKLKGSNGVYACTLKTGLNHIIVRAEYTDSEGEHNEQCDYEIKLIEETTPETAPYLAYNNVPTEVKGNLYTLDLAPRAYDGQILYYNNLNVQLNGYTISYKWDGEYVSYLLNLTAGENTLDIRVTDNEGRYTDYSFVISCLTFEDGDVIGYAMLEGDANVLGLGTFLPQITIEIKQGESAADAITAALEQNGYSVSRAGDYLARFSKDKMAVGAAIPDELMIRLKNDNDVEFNDRYDENSLGEKDFTDDSGWMICVNGHYISYGAGDLHLKDGDRIQLRYTLSLGKDIGGYVGTGSNYDIQY